MTATVPRMAGEATAVAGAGPPLLRAIPSGAGGLASYDLALALVSPEASLTYVRGRPGPDGLWAFTELIENWTVSLWASRLHS